MSLTSQGYKRTNYEGYLQMLQAEARELFGNDVNLNDDSVLGQYIKLLAYKDAKIDEKIEDVYYSDSIDNATGLSLDYAVKRVGITRRPAQKATGQITINGDVGSPVNVGFIVGVNNGPLFVTMQSGIIGASGSITLPIEATESGSIGNTPGGTIKVVRTAVPGITGCTNALPTSGGLEFEVDSQLRTRYYESLALGGGSSTDAITAALRSLGGVQDAYVNENTSNVTVGGLPPHGLAPFIYGGEDMEIAQTILTSKAAGISSYGTTTITIMDSRGNPKVVGFSRPSIVNVYVRITLVKNASYPTNGDELAKQSTVEYIGGTYQSTEYTGLGLGDNVIQYRVLANLTNIPGIDNATVEFSTDGTTWTNSNFAVADNQIPRTDNTKITVV